MLAVMCRPCCGWQCHGVQALRIGRAPRCAPAGAFGDRQRRLVSTRAGGKESWMASVLGSDADAFRQGLLQTHVAKRFPGEAEEAACAVESWSTRMSPPLFSRVCKGPRLLKEVQEALPMLHWAKMHLASLPQETGQGA